MRFFLGLAAGIFMGSAAGFGAAVNPNSAKFLPAIPGGYYFDAARLDARQILPPPPARGSIFEQAEIETILQVQAARTPEEVALAQTIEKDNLFNNACVLGAWFTKKNLPLTAAFFSKVDADVSTVRTKDIFARKRPPFVDERVRPCVHVSDTGAYPSGHSLRAWIWAALLSEIFPEHGGDFSERARSVGWARVIGGTHYPSDTIAGQVLAKRIVTELFKNPAVRAEIERCREEAKPFVLKKAA